MTERRDVEEVNPPSAESGGEKRWREAVWLLAVLPPPHLLRKWSNYCWNTQL